jgi:hypothetical protein
VAEAIAGAGAEHEQAGEGDGIAGHQQARGRLVGVEAGEHGGQRGDDDGDAEDVDELDGAQRGHGAEARCHVVEIPNGLVRETR